MSRGLPHVASAGVQASFDIGGERAAAVLPLMLKPGAMGKMPAEQRAKLRQVTGRSTLDFGFALGEFVARTPVKLLDIAVRDFKVKYKPSCHGVTSLAPF